MGKLAARNRRRRFLRGSLALAGLGLLSGCDIPLAPSAQRARLHRVGCLLPFTPTSGAPSLEAFRRGLREHGYVEGQNIALEFRYTEGREERLPELAGELVRDSVDVILTGSSPAVQAAMQATTTIPIVFIAGDVVADGLVASLARPGGNATGLSLYAGDENAKRLELLKEAIPSLSRVAVLWSAFAPRPFTDTATAAQALGLQVLSLALQAPDALGSVLATAIAGGANGLIVTAAPVFATLQPQIVDFAAQHRLPGMAPQPGFARAGGLMQHGPNITENYRRAAAYVDKLLKGARPAALPVERPTTYEFIVNLKTAQALGLTIPPAVLQQATELIQ